MSLLPKIVQGSAMHVVEQAIRLTCALWLTPRMLNYLGETNYGLWGLLTSIFTQFVLLDLGLCTSMPRFLSRAIGQGNTEELCRSASTGTAGMFIIGVLAQIAGVVTWFGLPWFLKESHELGEARNVVIALMVTSLTFWLGRPLMLHLQSQLRRDLIALASIMRLLITTPSVAWALSNGRGIETVAWIHALGALGELILFFFFDRAFFRLVRWPWVNRAKARELLVFARWSYVLTTSERIRSGFSGADLFIVAAFLGSAMSGIYSLGQRLAYIFYEVAYAIVGAQLLSTFSQLDGAGDRERLKQSFVAASRISAQLAVIGGGILWATGPAFLKRWVPAQAEEATPVLLYLIIPHILCATQIPSRHLLISLARHRPLALTCLAGILLNLLLTVLWVQNFGMVGAAIATFVEMTLLYGIAIPWLVITQTEFPRRLVVWESLWKPLLKSSLLLSPAILSTHLWLGAAMATYTEIASAIVLLAVVFFTFLALGLLGKEEKRWFLTGYEILFKRPRPAVNA
ncbi:Membrane protein involved in the export of O-antigen and teichoic acid [Prosthecobacter debontii]|uniref:Membrane protein involved in the export of O-antigen and teichoic acid n=1 Tax=Prosthecobacter debontii TaxID=48467 RepID=A0A1T4Z1J9_9BACT|nr:polysaccharide biosynthesis C-terminal domain-containing protein [Prosthecobacter debontii]SKB07435.1 Membrane protein involved in the export of O-antigen and teichoic acid [Prosthecobacter debontii]